MKTCYGKFKINRDLFTELPDKVEAVLSSVEVVTTVDDTAMPYIEYRGVSSEFFEPIDEFDEVPWYDVFIDEKRAIGAARFNPKKDVFDAVPEADVESEPEKVVPKKTKKKVTLKGEK